MAKRARRGTSELAERADRLSRDLERDFKSMFSVLIRDPDWYSDKIIEADDTGFDVQPEMEARLSDQEIAHLTRISQVMGATPGEDIIQMRRWARTRVVYVIDDDTASAVQATDWGDTVIPGEVLARLPHPNPMVVLPTPIRLPSYAPDGDISGIEEYYAFLICGARDPRRRCSTDDPRCNRLILHFLGQVLDPVTLKPEITSGIGFDGGARNIKWMLGLRTIVSLDDATMAERQKFAVDDTLSRLPANRIGFKDDEHAAQATADLLALGLALTIFLVTDDLDAQTSTVTPKASKGHRSRDTRDQGASDTTTVVEVGYRLGRALRNARHTDKENAVPGDGKRTVSPHIRRAHIHRFWKGPRSDPDKRYQVLHWLPPVPVAWQGTPDKTQIHRP